MQQLQAWYTFFSFYSYCLTNSFQTPLWLYLYSMSSFEESDLFMKFISSSDLPFLVNILYWMRFHFVSMGIKDFVYYALCFLFRWIGVIYQKAILQMLSDWLGIKIITNSSDFCFLNYSDSIIYLSTKDTLFLSLNSISLLFLYLLP